MASWDGGPKLVQVGGESATLENRLREPLVQALSERRTWYAVRVEAVGRIGDVLVSITGSKGRLPLLFRHDELEPGHVSTVVRGAVDRFALWTLRRSTNEWRCSCRSHAFGLCAFCRSPWP